MTPYEIEVSEPAEMEIEAAWSYLLLRSSDAAVKLSDGLQRAIDSLSLMPSRCPYAPENGMLDRPIRQLLYRNAGMTYRILFIVIEATEDNPGLVRITRVRHGGQQQLGFSADDPDEN